MDKSDIIYAVAGGGFSTEDLTDILYAVRKAWRGAAKTRVALFSPGDSVTFVHSGKLAKGTVVRMNKSSAVVKCGEEEQKVSLISLKRSEE